MGFSVVLLIGPSNNDSHQPVGAVDIPFSSGPSPTRLDVIVMRFHATFVNAPFNDLCEDEKRESDAVSGGVFLECDVRPMVGDKIQLWSTNENSLYTVIVREVRLGGCIQCIDGVYRLDCTEQHEVDLEWFDVA